MVLIVMISIVAVAIIAAVYAPPGFVRSMIVAGILLAVGAWLPLLAGLALDPEGEVIGNALGLGLLAWFGSALGFLVIIVGLVIRLRQMLA
ncbi:MAG TPA: hypothetical protein VLQ65_01190 [Saliniramus sp.]|nr:hypothetical protein [Saliniramus sp.]